MNKTFHMGRLTHDPEVSFTQGNNMCVCKFSIAVPRAFKKEGQPDVDFFKITAFGKTAEFVSKYFTKGRQILVVGRLQNRDYDDKEGRKVYVTEIIADEVHFADSKKDGGDSTDSFEKGFNPKPTKNEGFAVVENNNELPF